MFEILKYAVVTILAALALQTYAVPAKRGTQIYTQPDGSTVEVKLHGDEFFHYYLTADNLPLIEDSDGSLFFAKIENGNLSKMPYLACDASDRSAELTRQVSGLNYRQVVSLLRKRAMNSNRRRSIPQQGMGRFETTFPSKGELKALVLLVEYSDVKFTLDNPKQYFTDMLNLDDFSEYGATGCARQYFLDASNGQFDLHSDVYGPVTLPRSRAYYGSNDMMGNDSNPEDMVIHAIEILKNEVDFSQYDCDKDGILDNVFVFYAGTGEASGGPAQSVWPHAWNLAQAGKSFTVDGVVVDHYACTCEWQGETPDGIGTFCHEFSHIMGLPDLYNTAGDNANYTPGEWSVMDYGPYNNNSRTPPTYSAYERNAMGWLDVDLVTEGTSVTLDDIKSTNRAVMIATTKPKEFFLFENRQQTSWDTYLPHHGMLIWHVDYNDEVWRYNSVNNDRDHQYVDLIEANGVGESAKGAAWPGIHEKTSFTAGTVPAFLDWSKKDLGLPITEIAEENGKIYFDVDGGDFELAAPSEVTISDLTPISLKLSWNAVERAKGYTVSVSFDNGIATEFVPGFKTAKYEAPITSTVISGLDAETEYTIEIIAFSGTRTSSSTMASAKTPVMTFPYMTPKVLPAESITENSFVARWEPVNGADHYLLSVEGAFEVKPTTEMCNFGSLIFRVPAGWEYSLKTSRYTDPNWCGKAAPSAKMDQDGATLTTPYFEHDILSCSIWTKLSNNKPECSLAIDGLVDGKWQRIESFDNISTFGTNSSIEAIPDGTRQLRFTYLQSGKTALALDDIEIEIGGVSRKILESYNELNVGNEVSFLVENLPADKTGFYYKVTAVSSSDERTLPSLEQYVEHSMSAVDVITSDLTERSVSSDSNGNVYCYGQNGDKVEIYTIDGKKILSSTIENENSLMLPIHKNGFFIVRIGNSPFKIFI